MNNRDGMIWYGMGIDNNSLGRDAKESSNIFRGIGDTVESEGARIDAVFNKIGKKAAGVFGAIQLKSFIGDVIRVRSEFQNTEASFRVFLGSAEKASKFMKEMQGYAFHNVFEFQDLTEQAAALLAYQHQLEDVIPIIDKLSNIAAGANKPLSQLVELYNKAKSQGKLLTQDIQQWQRAGVPVIQELAKEFSKTEAEMWKMVTTGTVGFKEIDTVINKLTSDGGMFAGMMEERMKTLGDSIGQLEDSITAMFNEIGEKTQEYLRTGILAVNDLVENYEKVGKVLLSLIATYGSYKAAVILTNVVLKEQAAINAMVAASNGVFSKSLAYQWVWTERLQKSHAALQKTMLTNPWVLGTTVVVGLVATIWSLYDATTTQEKAQQRLNEINEQAKERKEELSSETSRLTGIINSENKSILEQVTALRDLQKMYPGLFKDMDIHTFKALGTTEQQRLLNEAMNDMEFSQAENTLNEQREKVIKLQKDIIVNKEIMKNMDADSVASMQYAVSLLEKRLKEEELILDGLEKQREEREELKKEAEFQQLPEKERLAILDKQLSNLEKQREFVDKLIEKSGGLNNVWWQLNPILVSLKNQWDKITESIEKTKNSINNVTGVNTVKNKSYWEGEKTKAEAALNQIDSNIKEKLLAGNTKGIDKDIVDSFKENQKKLKEAKKNLELYDYSDKDANKIQTAQEKLKQKIVDGELAIVQAQIDAMKDGQSKQLAQIDLNYKQTIAKINKEEEELKKARLEAGQGNLTPEEIKGFADRRTYAGTAKENEEEKVNKQYSEELKEMYGKITNVFLTEEERKQKGIKKTFDDYRKWLEEAKRSISKEDYDKLSKLIESSELETQLYDSLQEFRTYEQKRADIVKEYQQKIDLLRDKKHNGKYAKEIKEAEKQMAQAVAELDDTMLNTTTLWGQLFDNFAHYTTKELQEIINNARAVVDYVNNTSIDDIQANFGLSREKLMDIKSNATELGAVYDALRQKIDELNKRNPFAALTNSFQAVKKIQTEIRKAEQELSKINKETDKDAYEAAEKKLQGLKRQQRLLKGDFKEAAQSAASYLGDVGEAMRQIGEAAENAGLASFGKALSEVGDIAKQAFSGDYIGAGINAVATGLTAIFSSNSKYKANLRQMKSDLAAFAHDYKMTLSDMRLQADDLGNIFGEDSFAKAKVALEEAHAMYGDFIDRVNKKTERKGFFAQMMNPLRQGTDLENIKIVTRHKTAFRSEKSKTLKELYPELFQGEYGFDVDAAKSLLATNNQLNDAAKQQIQEVIDLYDQWQEAEEKFKDYLSSTFGDIGDSLGDSIVKAFEDGTDAMENWAESFNSVLKNLGKQLMQTLFLQKHFDKLEEDLTNIYENYGDDPDKTGQKVTELLSNFFNDMSGTVSEAEEWYKNFADQAAKYGFDLSGSESETATAKGFNAMSQDVGNEMNGQMRLGVHFLNLMHEDTAEIREYTNGLCQYTSSIRDNMSILVNNSNAILNHVAGIHSNTDRLETIEGHLYNIGNTVNKMDMHGVHIQMR